MRRKSKIRTVRNLFAASLAFSVVGAIGEVGYAFPGLGANCAQCHTTSGGNVEPSPSPLTLLPGQTGTVTFDVSDLPGTPGALSLTGLDAPGLDTTPDPDWQPQDNDTRFTLSGIDGDSQQMFDVIIGSAATAGDYQIGVFLAGAGGWSTMSEFTISVGEVAIPEPATVTLVSILLAIGAINITRRPRRQ